MRGDFIYYIFVLWFAEHHVFVLLSGAESGGSVLDW